MKTLIPFLLAASLAACSPLPDAIAPAPMTGLADGLARSVARSELATEHERPSASPVMGAGAMASGSGEQAARLAAIRVAISVFMSFLVGVNGE